ncbi:MAG: HNH endonuclease [Thermoleophilaceae bacterium]
MIICQHIARPPDGNGAHSRWRKIKRHALRHARGICQRCGHPSRDLLVHHLVPVSEGGGNSWGNAVVVGPDCHRELHKH